MLSLLFFSVASVTRDVDPENNVMYVNEHNITDALTNLPATLLMVQMSQEKDEKFNGHAEFLAAAKTLGSRCFFAVMDGDRNSRFTKKLNQQDQKAYYFFRYGKLICGYQGPQTADSITEFAMSKTGIPFKTFDDYVVAQDFIESNNVAIVIFLSSTKHPLFDKFQTVAGQLRDNYTFGMVPDEDLAGELEVEKTPTMIMYRNTDKTKHVYPDILTESSVEDIVRWINYNAKPSFSMFNIANQKAYANKKIALFFTSVEENARDECYKLITQLSAQYNSDLTFAAIDAVSGSRFMTGLGFSKFADPTVAILQYNGTNYTKYLYDENADWGYNELSEFFEQFLDGKLKPLIKSKKIEDKNEGPVFETTADLFESDVINSTNPSIVLYYESWDRLYTQFLPDYESIAKSFSGQDIKFYKFSVAENEIVNGPDPKKTPCVYIFPSEKGRKPILLKGILKKEKLLDLIADELDMEPKHIVQSNLKLDNEL